MTPDDRKAFAEVVIGFAELKGRKLSSASIELYWRSLQHWPIAAFRSAAEQLIRTCEFMPGPKDFEDLRKAGRPTPGEAWERARRASGTAIQCGRITQNGTCGDELIDRAARAIGGYGVIAMTDTDKLPFLERRFAEHYDTIRDADDTREAVPQIAYSQITSKLLDATQTASIHPTRQEVRVDSRPGGKDHSKG